MMDENHQEFLDTVEIRVLGALMEKARTTPDQYPLTLNSLLSACNQKTSRDPVTDHDEDEVLAALDSLRDKGLAMRVDVAGSRTAKFRENVSEKWFLSSQEYALLTLLFLRGPQTPGQLKGRSERLFGFAEIPQVLDWLQRMQSRDEEPTCLVQSLKRLPGTKEIRYAHTLAPLPQEDEASRPPDIAGATPDVRSNLPSPAIPTANTGLEERLDSLEKRVAQLETLMDELTS